MYVQILPMMLINLNNESYSFMEKDQLSIITAKYKYTFSY